MQTSLDIPIDVSSWQAELLADETPFVSVSGGYASGKTHLIGVYILLQCLRFPGCYAWCCNNTEKQADSSTWKAVQNFLESVKPFLEGCNVTYKFTHDYKLVFSNGSTVLFQTLGIPVGRLKGSELDFLVIDEADATGDIEKWKYVKARVRGKLGNRQIRIFLNPTNPRHWAISEFVNKPDHKLIIVSTYDNDFLDPQVIKNYELDYPPGTEDHKRWMLGQVISMEGAAFKQFNLERHVIRPDQVPAAAKIWVYAMDLGFADPTTFLEGVMTGDGALYITREYGASSLDPEQHLPFLLDMYQGGPVYADHSATQHNYYARYGLQMIKADKGDKTVCVEYVRRRLHHNMVKISTACPRLIDDLFNYKVDVLPSGKEVFGRGPNHIFSHYVDALQYLIIGVDKPSLFE